jgi:hypothetical protein
LECDARHVSAQIQALCHWDVQVTMAARRRAHGFLNHDGRAAASSFRFICYLQDEISHRLASRRLFGNAMVVVIRMLSR